MDEEVSGSGGPASRQGRTQGPETPVRNVQRIRCAECTALCPAEALVLIDGTPVCRRCLFGDHPPVLIYPIGFVRNAQQRAESGFGLRGHGGMSRIELLPSQRRFMYKLEDEERLTIVYHLHEARPVRSRIKRGLDGKEVGVFASRTPDRLSPIGIQDVRLVRVQETTLIVEGLDTIDGTPVLDIEMCPHPA